jgi:hypothetical protein
MMVDMFPRERLAKLIRNAFPTDMMAIAIAQLDIRLWAHQQVCHKVPNNEDLANITEGFVGAYFVSEGTFFSDCKFLLWLQQRSGEEDSPKPWENAVVGHVLCGSGHPFRGQATSYLEFQEMLVGAEKRLRVTYTDEDKPSWIEYRRYGLGPNNRKFVANYCTAIIQRTALHMHTTRITEDDVEVQEPSKTFAVSALRHSMFRQVLFL